MIVTNVLLAVIAGELAFLLAIMCVGVDDDEE